MDIVSLTQNLIHNFSIENLQELLLAKNPNFELYQTGLFDFEDEFFTETYEIGKVKLKDSALLKAYAIKVATNLTERTSKIFLLGTWKRFIRKVFKWKRESF